MMRKEQQREKREEDKNRKIQQHIISTNK